LDSTLSFNDHIEHLRKKLSKVLGAFSRARPALTLEAANRVYAAMILPILDYCDIVWHESGQGNDKVVERLQRRAARIVYSSNAAELSTDEIITKLGWEPLTKRREAHVVSLVSRKCIKNDVPSYFKNYCKLRNFHIHNYNTRSRTNLFSGKSES